MTASGGDVVDGVVGGAVVGGAVVKDAVVAGRVVGEVLVDVELIVEVEGDSIVLLTAPVVLASCLSLEQAAARNNNAAASTDLIARTVVAARCDV